MSPRAGPAADERAAGPAAATRPRHPLPHPGDPRPRPPPPSPLLEPRPCPPRLRLRRPPPPPLRPPPLPLPSLPLFNATLKALSLSPSAAPDALHLFSLLCHRSLSPDHLSFAPLFKAASFLPAALGLSVHALTLVSGFSTHPPVAVGILEIYTSSGEMNSAHRAFDEMFQKDVVVYNLMINGYCKRGDCDTAFRLFGRMAERSIVTWNSMIAGLARCGRDGEALGLFREMWDDSGFEPDDATLATVTPVCGRLGALDVGKWIHHYADKKGLLNTAVNVVNSIIDMYCKCGRGSGICSIGIQ